MHLPAPAPALRGAWLNLVSRLVAIRPIRDFILNTLVIKNAGVDRMPGPK
jgi:hypothetical protein